jgi:hypothetical protein
MGTKRLIALAMFGAMLSSVSAKEFSGKIRFEVDTNMGISFEGEHENQIKVKTSVDKKSGTYQIEKLSLPAKMFKTGMELRDDHMNDQIFKDKPVGISMDQTCKVGKPCKAKAKLNIAGKDGVATIEFSTFSDKSIKGKSELSLKALGIEAPSMAGVTVEDKVVVHLEFSAK